MYLRMSFLDTDTKRGDKYEKASVTVSKSFVPLLDHQLFELEEGG